MSYTTKISGRILVNLFPFLIAAGIFISGCESPKPVESISEYVEIFDGKTLNGWEGDSVYWKVENGNLVGEVTPETLLKRNTFIIWRGGTVEDFELEFQYRITRNGNSGINYRSEELKDIPYALRGYQGDIDGYDDKPYTGMNYEERGRTTIAKRGQKVELSPVPTGDSLKDHIKDNVWIPSIVTASLGNDDSLKLVIKDPGNWNDYHIVAKGNHLQHFINGVLLSDVIDNDPANSKASGLLGVQVHVGPPMKVEFRHFRLKHLK